MRKGWVNKHSRRTLISIARSELARRRARSNYLARDYFAEPAWNMLLDLYIADYRRETVLTKEMMIASGVPSTTAIRWLDVLEEEGDIARFKSTADRRMTFVQLTTEGRIRCDHTLLAMLEAERMTADDRHPVLLNKENIVLGIPSILATLIFLTWPIGGLLS